MAKELLIGVVIGGAIAGSFLAATSGAKTTLNQLGRVAEDLKTKHGRLGDVMARAFAHPSRNVAVLRQDYERLGRTLDQVRIKQERLTAQMAVGKGLKTARTEAWGSIKETVGVGVAVGAPVFKSVQIASAFQDQMRDIAITGDMNSAQEARVGQLVRDAAQKYNQTQTKLGEAVGVLVGKGLADQNKLAEATPLLGKVATATKADMADLAKTYYQMDLMGVKDKALGFNQLALAGKLGSFETRDMAKWIPSIGGLYNGLGISGNEAIVNMASRLQIATRTAGSNDEAANNYKNFLTKITSTDTAKDFKRQGIDLEARMKEAARKGLDPVEAGVTETLNFLGRKAPEAALQIGKLAKELASIKDPAERAAELERRSEFLQSLASRFQLGNIFQDMQATNYLLAEIQNRDELKAIQARVKTGKNESGKNVIDEDFSKRMATVGSQFGRLKIGLSEIGITIGEALLPPLNEALVAVMPLIKGFGAWAKEHPGLIRGVVGLVGGVLALKLGVLGLGWGFNFLVASPLNAFKTALTVISSNWIRVVSLMQLGRFASVASGLRIAGQAVIWLGRALLATPIGWIVGGIGLAALLIYKFWGPIKGYFVGLWQGLKEGLAPLSGAFRAAFAPIAPILRPIGNLLGKLWGWFSDLMTPIKDTGGAAQSMGHTIGTAVGFVLRALISLPLKIASLPLAFARLGGEIINGLINGVTAKFTQARDTIVQFGTNIKGWFASTLGIKSPSRVFMGMGDNIAQGAAIGIQRSSSLASRAAAAMAKASGGAAQDALPGTAGRSGASAARGQGMTVYFSPTIQVQGGPAERVREAVNEGLKLSMREFEQMLARVQANKTRTAY